ncbi:hypothetical protein AFUA_3G02430 [Aspergillus fumigatus Af293]|uniref:Uncharacterized protein n=2 Tax=Aspergillus fumigatus TaxID=746128 RepID=Q4WFE9_ASPFU|nr:hypothetical protein AFUA_3G02430 [Aspergillus fumigatus Af293]EAL86528.2 hypothetical protein AFUA_3G02430 [Aspergillus fumigatus Af293]
MASSQDNFVSKTNPDPYDQIIVLSQKVINAGFKNMWKLAQGDDDSPLTHFKKSIHGEYIEADVGIPSVKLHVESREPMLYFLLALKNGEMAVYESDDSDTLFKWDIKDWVLAFNVVINQKKITKDSEEYRKFKERAGLPESNFSLAQLFIDASSSTKFNPDLTSFGEHNLNELTPAAKASVLQFIDHWIKVMSESGSSILGYSAQREQVNGGDELDGSGANKDDQDSNALAYLLMSDFKNPPAEGSIQYSGPWVDGDDRVASFCMNRALFWNWMLPIARQVVVAMTPVPETPYVSYAGTPPDMPWRTRPRYHIGDTNASANDYKWVPNPSGGWSTSMPMKFTWDKVTVPHNSNDWMIGEEWGDNTQATVSFGAGTERLTVKGGSKFRYQIDHHRDGMSGTRQVFWVEVFTDWRLSIDMTSIEEGGIVFHPKENNNEDVKVAYKEYGDMKMESTAQDLAESIADDVKQNMTAALESVSETLSQAMANANRLCLPAAGTFFMKDPVFNEGGDLLVKLEYDGADPPPPPSKGKYRFRPPMVTASVRRMDS